MINIRGLQMDVQLGTFHGVVAIGATDKAVTILDKTGVEMTLPFKAVFDPRTAKFRPVKIDGAFGVFDDAQGHSTIPGLALQDIERVSVDQDQNDDRSWKFHRRTLRLHTSSGVSLAWDLFCEGKAA